MKSFSRKIVPAVITILCTLAVSTMYAQSVGEYRSASSGNWSSPGTWQMFNGTSWVAATSAPSGSDTITIQAAHTVTVNGSADTLSGKVTVDGYLLDSAGIVSTGTFIFDNGSTYEYAHAAGTYGIPTATWNTGSTCLITGVTSSTTNINGKQNFYNLIVNSPGWSASLNFGWNSGTVTIGGDVTVKNTGSGRWQMCAPTAGTVSAHNTDTVTIDGNLIVDGSAADASDKVTFTSNGTSNNYTDITINIMGNITVSGNPSDNTLVNFAASRGSQGGTGTALWNVHGDVTISNTTTQNSNPTGARFVFVKQGLQTLKLSNIAFGGGGFPVEVQSGSTLDLDTSVIAGSGIFKADSASTIMTSHASGLNGNLTNSGAITFSPFTNYTYDGTVTQVTGMLLPDTVNTLTASNTDTLLLSDSLHASNIVVSSGSRLEINQKVYTSKMTSAGLVIASDTLMVSDTATFNNGSVYDHAMNGGSLPTGVWNTGSTLEITGATGNAPSNGNQNFYNVLWNCPGQSSNLNLGWNGNTIFGNITVQNTGSSRWQMCAPLSDSTSTVRINGDVNVSGGNFTTNGTSNASTTIVVNDYGNVNVTGGNFSIGRGSQGNGTGTATWNMLSGNFMMSNATTQNSNPTGGKFVFAKQGTQTLKLSGMTFGGGGLPIWVKSGTTLDIDTSVIGGDGPFTLDSAATIISRHANGLNGNLATTGTVSLSQKANYMFSGTVPQAIGALLPSSVNNLTVQNNTGVSLSDTTAVNDTLALLAGKLSLGHNSITIGFVKGASDSTYIVTSDSGSVKRNGVGSSQVMFPVGTSGAYAPVALTNAGTSDNFSVAVAPDTTNGANRVDVHWKISEDVIGGSNATVQLGWMSALEGSNFAANRESGARIFRLSDSLEVGTGDYTSQLTNQPYTVARGGVTSFGTFIVGRITGIITGIAQNEKTVPIEFALHQNFPNPFNPTTTLQFTVKKEGPAKLDIVNILGQKVAEIFHENAVPGKLYEVQFNGSDLSSGIYFGVLQSGSDRQIKKMMLLK
jgi:Secretion system C-terminal sorting domain